MRSAATEGYARARQRQRASAGGWGPGVKKMETGMKTPWLTDRAPAFFFLCSRGPTPARSRSAAPLRGASLRHLARAAGAAALASLAVLALLAADLKVDLSKERVGRPPATFEP